MSVKSQINTKTVMKTVPVMTRPMTAKLLEKLVVNDSDMLSFETMKKQIIDPTPNFSFSRFNKEAEQAYTSTHLNYSSKVCGQSEPSLADTKNFECSTDQRQDDPIRIKDQEQINQISKHIIQKSKQKTRVPNENTGVFSLQSVESCKMESSVKKSHDSLGHESSESNLDKSFGNSKKYPLIHLRGKQQKIHQLELRAKNQRVST